MFALPLRYGGESKSQRIIRILPSIATRKNRYHQLTVERINGTLDTVSVADFRARAFLPEKPILIANESNGRSHLPSLPAFNKWFTFPNPSHGQQGEVEEVAISQGYFLPFGDTILPYELITQNEGGLEGRKHDEQLSSSLARLIADSDGTTFHHFNAPLALFLRACDLPQASRTHRLYIAQAQIADLPKTLRDDLPTPKLVKEAGKGDVYDANIWLGTPPTYTPLHKDPNPNLFVQLAGRKEVRLIEPRVGSGIYWDVQAKIRQVASESFRGTEMMEGPERELLENAVWGDTARDIGKYVVVKPGDALFVPKGWWHSIKSMGSDINASVNWWFR